MVQTRRGFGITSLPKLMATKTPLTNTGAVLTTAAAALLMALPSGARPGDTPPFCASAWPAGDIRTRADKFFEKQSVTDKVLEGESGALEQPLLMCLRSEQDAAVNSVKANGTQLKYWIELDRDGKKLHVTNQETFRTGDKIKFHMQASADGFLYIVLRTGSRGEQEILFPHPKLKDNNHIVKNVDYVLPADDYLLFDEFPGTEKLVLMFSHQPIELKQALASKNRVVLRGGAGSKDLVPANATVSYSSSDAAKATSESSTSVPPDSPKSMIVPATKAATTPATVTGETRHAEVAESSNKPPSAEPSVPQKQTPTTSASKTEAGLGERVQQSHGDVVVRHDDPTQVLTVDIDLVHK